MGQFKFPVKKSCTGVSINYPYWLILILEFFFEEKYPQCVGPENIHAPTTEGMGNPRGWGGQRPRKFQRGGQLDSKNHFPRGYFQTQYKNYYLPIW